MQRSSVAPSLEEAGVKPDAEGAAEHDHRAQDDGLIVEIQADRRRTWSTWTGGARAVGKTFDKARRVWDQCVAYEEAGAFAVEIEVVPAEITALIAERTGLYLISMGGGGAGHAQYLFAEDVLGQNTGHVPRHAKRYADFAAELARLQDKRIAAMRAFAEDVVQGGYPSDDYVVHAMDEVVQEFGAWLQANASGSSGA